MKDTRKCFVISPIGAEGSEVREHADDVFDFIIRPAMDKCRIRAVRSDHLREPGKISDHMFSEILSDQLCVAVLTHSHLCGKPPRARSSMTGLRESSRRCGR